MKKILSLVMVAMLALSAWATEVTFTPATVSGSDQISKDGVYIDITGGDLGSSYSEYRIYKGKTMTIWSSAKITRIEFTCTANGTAKYGPGCFASQAGYSYEGKIGTWVGNAESVSFTAETNQVRATKIVVTLEDEATSVSTPVISGTTPFVGSTQVSISCEAQDASVYYTTDGTTPSSESTAYSQPFTIEQTTVVKAIAYDATGAASAVATKVFNKSISAATVADIYKLNDGDTFVFTGRLVVTAQTSTKSNLYAQDETGAIHLYGYNIPQYEQGDVIPAGFTATYSASYHGAPELIDLSGMEEATETVQVEPMEVTPYGVDLYTSLFRYAVIKNANVNGDYIEVGDEYVKLHNQFGVDAPEDADYVAYDIYGICSFYDEEQFLPLEFVEHQEQPVVENYINYTAQQENGTVAVTLQDGTPVESMTTKVAAGEKFTVTATAAQGYTVASMTVTANGAELTPVNNEEAAAFMAAGNQVMTNTYEMPEAEATVIVSFDQNTGIDSIGMSNVKAVRYYNAVGVESATPFQGMNIVVREMNDGSKSIVKEVK